MGLRWGDPFEQYGGDEAAMLQGPCAQLDSGVFVLSNTRPRTGDWALRFAPTSAALARRVFGDNLQVVKIGFGIYLDALPTTENPFNGGSSAGGFLIGSFRDATNSPQVSFQLGTNGQIRAYTNGGGLAGFPTATHLDDSDPTVLIPAAAYSHLEYKIGIGNSDGFIEVRLNQVPILNLTGLDTDYTNAGEISQFAFGAVGLFTTGCSGYLDDMVCSDDQGSYNTDFVGDKKLYYFPPASDTALADFALSSGSTGYTLLDESPPNDADYISIAASTGKSAFGIDSLPGDVASIAGVIALIRSNKDDAGTCDMKPGIRQGSTFASGAGQPQTTVKQYYDQAFEVDPVSGVPFAPADIDSLELVVERSA